MTTVIVPWRQTENPLREHALGIVRDHLISEGFDFLLAITEGDWSPGAARNLGATCVDDDVLVFNDADSICPGAQIRAAIESAQTPGLVFAYTTYMRVAKDGTIADGPYLAAFPNSPSMGAVAISRTSFEEVGGFDESYVGWGYEDIEFVNRCAARWPLRRIPGEVFHLWHGDRRPDDAPEDSDPNEVAANLRRLRGDSESAVSKAVHW